MPICAYIILRGGVAYVEVDMTFRRPDNSEDNRNKVSNSSFIASGMLNWWRIGRNPCLEAQTDYSMKVKGITRWPHFHDTEKSIPLPTLLCPIETRHYSYIVNFSMVEATNSCLEDSCWLARRQLRMAGSNPVGTIWIHNLMVFHQVVFVLDPLTDSLKSFDW